MNRHFRYLTSAMQHQRDGRLQQAERIYRRILREDGGNAMALHLLGLVAHQLGDRKSAAQYIARAIQIQPSVPEFRCSLGNVLRDMGLHEQALLCYRAAISYNPDYGEAQVSAGSSLQALGRHEAAVPYYLAAIRADQNCAEAYNNLGNAWVALGRIADGITLLQHAIQLKPNYAAARVNLASALSASGMNEEALGWCREAIKLNPRLAPAHVTLGTILFGLNRYGESAAASQEALRLDPELAEAYSNLSAVRLHERNDAAAEELARRALALRPDYPEALNNLGQAILNQSRISEARICLEDAVRLKPEHAGAWCNLANARKYLMDFEEAEACYREAVRLRAADAAVAQFNLALLLLALGRFEEGWKKYEWRWRQKDNPPPSFDGPTWDGTGLEGHTILVRAEQGLGDTIQFIRYAPLLKRQGASVILECQPRLLPLLKNFEGADRVIGIGGERPEFDLYAFLLSLPYLSRTRAESIPGGCPYIHPDPALVRLWAERLGDSRGVRVGINWAGNPGHPDDSRRSFVFSDLEPLLRIPGISWVSLQRGEPAWQLACSEWADTIRQVEDDSTTIADTAAIVANLDLVISADTMVAHLAGALGKPVWLLLCAVPDWRWMLGRTDSPWYPTMRLFRQSEPGDWPGVIAQVGRALAERVAPGP